MKENELILISYKDLDRMIEAGIKWYYDKSSGSSTHFSPRIGLRQDIMEYFDLFLKEKYTLTNKGE